MYVFHGSPAGMAMQPSWKGEGNANDTKFGTSASTAGDVNGDGYSDVVIGADQWNNTKFEEGRAFVYLGSAVGLAAAPVWFIDGGENSAYYVLGYRTSKPELDGKGRDITVKLKGREDVVVRTRSVLTRARAATANGATAAEFTSKGQAFHLEGLLPDLDVAFSSDVLAYATPDSPKTDVAVVTHVAEPVTPAPVATTIVVGSALEDVAAAGELIVSSLEAAVQLANELDEADTIELRFHEREITPIAVDLRRPLTIRAGSDGLHFQLGAGLIYGMFPASEDVFYVPGLDYWVAFSGGHRPSAVHIKSMWLDVVGRRI